MDFSVRLTKVACWCRDSHLDLQFTASAQLETAPTEWETGHRSEITDT